MKTKFSLFLCLLAIFSFFHLSDCLARSYEILPRHQQLISLEIHGDYRGRLPFIHEPSYYMPGSDLRIEARRGERFSIRITNRSRYRLGMVISIDGLNIISGKRSYNRPDESMYLLSPGQHGNFDGWRTDLKKVQRFYFTDADDSYAGRIGETSQIGWIKVAVFREKGAVILRPDSEEFPKNRRYNDASVEKSFETSQAGTGYGEGSYSPVELSEFNPEPFPVEVYKIKYDFSEKMRPDGGFVTPPPGYQHFKE
jgi:hypothetical protein